MIPDGRAASACAAPEGERRAREDLVESRRASAIASVALVGLLIALYWQIGRELVAQWSEDPNYSHGFLVFPFSAYLAWCRRDELRRLQPRPSSLGLPIVVLGLATLILGVIGAENFLARGSFIGVAAGLVLFHLGPEVLRVVALPLGFLLFMIPLPQIVFNAIAFPLQTFAAENATAILDAIGVPVLRDGNVIHLSRISLGVAEACSGIRSLISLLALAVAWGHLSLRTNTARITFVLSAVPITIGANAGRIVVTGLVGQWFGAGYAEGFFHEFSGWLIFLVAFGLLLGVHTALSRLEGDAPRKEALR
jgi:exosortase